MLPVVICFFICGGCIEIAVSIPYGLTGPCSVNVLAWFSVTGYVYLYINIIYRQCMFVILLTYLLTYSMEQSPS